MEEFEYDGSVWVCGDYRIVRSGASWRLRNEGFGLDERFADWTRAAERAAAMMAAEEDRAEPVDVVDDEDGDEAAEPQDG